MEACWCWLDDFSEWIEYGIQHPKYSATAITSAQLEQAFQADQKGTVRFQVNSQKYEINFKDMVQRNLHTRNTRKICRWPKYASSDSGRGESQRERTEGYWYWLDEFNRWNKYGERSLGHHAATITSVEVEKAFQDDPKGTLRFRAGLQQYEINFKDMVQRNLHSQKIRKICRHPTDVYGAVGNQQGESTGQCWYWLDDSNKWVEYGDKSLGHHAATITSAEVEKAFQDDPKGTLRFRVGLQQYEINFKDMVQINLYTEVQRAICRRPNNASGEEEIQQQESVLHNLSITDTFSLAQTGRCCWYWLDEHGHWVEFGEQHEDQHAAPLPSAEVELLFQADQEGTFEFEADSQIYELDFKEMVQRNLNTQTVIKIYRKPSGAMGGSSKQDNERQSDAAGTCHQFPSDWDLSAVPKMGYQLVEVSRSTSEYTKIKDLFNLTMKDHKIRKLQRVQNPALLQHFQLQKEQMKKRSPGKEVDERFLFHGTSKSCVAAICEQNFDWRVYGAHGTKYGKGSYFARDASYAHRYCLSSSGCKSMFVARVLVGDFVQGSAEYRRPPPRPENPNRLYDSCVDDPEDPSIFVIFEKLQIYPAYVLEYTHSSE